MSATDAKPAQVEILSVETLQLVADLSADLAQAENLSLPTAVLTRLDNGTDYSSTLLSQTALALSNKGVSTVVSGLTPRKSYLLIFQGTVATNKKPATKIRIDCPA